eukprot:779420-Pelagomonas_calceolata.AAC.1
MFCQGNNIPHTSQPFSYINNKLPHEFKLELLRPSTASTHASTAERPNSPALKSEHFPNLRDAPEKHMHSKHRLGKASIETGYYFLVIKVYWEVLHTDHKKVSNAFWTMPILHFNMK